MEITPCKLCVYSTYVHRTVYIIVTVHRSRQFYTGYISLREAQAATVGGRVSPRPEEEGVLVRGPRRGIYFR